MKPLTDLESLIRRLAGRDDFSGLGDSRSSNHLEDQSPDTSQFFDEIRRRTKMLLDEPNPDGLTLSRLPDAAATSSPGSRLSRWIPEPSRTWTALTLVALVSNVILMGLLWAGQERSNRRELRESTGQILGELRRGLAAQAAQAAPVVAEAGAIDPKNDALLVRLEAAVRAMGAKLDQFPKSGLATVAPLETRVPPGPLNNLANPVVGPIEPNANITADLAAIRRELLSSEAATTRQIQEMRTVLHEVNTVVRRVLSRPEPSSAASVGPILSVAIQALINNLQHPSPQVRVEAVEQLVRIGPPARSAVPALQQMLGRETHANIRSAVETALNVLSSN